MNASPIAFRLLVLILATLILKPDTAAFAADANTSPRRRSSIEKAEFDTVTLKRPGVILMANSGDLDGDGVIDLLLFHKPSKETYEKSCSVYFHCDNSLAAARPVEVPLGATISAIAIRDIDSDGKDEICGFDRDGMIVFEFGSDSSVRSNRLLERQIVLPSTARGLVAVNWIADVDSDGAMDIVLPVADGLLLLLQKEGGSFDEVEMFKLPARGSVSGEGGQSYVGYRLPTTHFSDYDGDGRTDIGAFDLEEMNFFLTAGTDLPNRHVGSPLLRKFTRDFIGGTDFPDLDANGVPDAVLVLMSQKKNLQSEVRIYFGKKDFSYGEEPSNSYSGETSLILPMFLDADGDGKMEMLLQNVDVGFGFFLNYFIRNRIRVDTELRKLAEDGRYDETPTIRRAIYVRASETGTEPGRVIGDFNGDGLDDLVVGTAEDRLSFFLSDERVIMPRSPTFELQVPSYGKMKALNLNDDGRTDLIILYSEDDKLDTATVLLSQ